jgi:CheY-like chemotaxis protein
MKILIVDDNLTFREGLATLLRVRGHEVDTCISALCVMQRVTDNDIPDAIILDYLLPSVNGLDLLSQLRRHEGWNNIPAVLVTGDKEIPAPSKSGPHKGPFGGPYALLIKPIDNVETILNAIEEAKGSTSSRNRDT